MIEGVDQSEMDFFNQLKRRTKSEYGLKYEIITLNNGSATLSSSSGSSSAPGPNYMSANSSSTTPLALALYAHNGLQSLIRCDFCHNAKICDVFGDEEASVNTKYLWQWFHSKIPSLKIKFLIFRNYGVGVLLSA